MFIRIPFLPFFFTVVAICMILGARCYCHHYIDEETEAQKS